MALAELFSKPEVLDELSANGDGVALAILDFTEQRAAIIRLLNAQNIPVTAWLLLPNEEGYWFNLRNYPQAVARYRAFREWALRGRLQFKAIGLDIEPTITDHTPARANGTQHLFSRAYLAQRNALYPAAREAYLDLVSAIRHDGYEVHTYQYPVIVDDRRSGTTLIQRMLDIVDLPVDQEVLMLYSSHFKLLFKTDIGGAFIDSYGQHADGIAVGVTGGGFLDPITGIVSPRVSLETFCRDLLIAAQYTDVVHIFSLEGCVDRNWLPELRALDWDKPVFIRWRDRFQISVLRGLLGFVLWCSRYGWTALGWLGWGVAGSMIVSRRISRWKARRHH